MFVLLSECSSCISDVDLDMAVPYSVNISDKWAVVDDRGQTEESDQTRQLL